MKKLIIAALLVVGMTTYAQNKKDGSERTKMERLTPQERQEKQLKKMTAELSLNAKQQEQVNQLLTDQKLKREKMMDINKTSKEEMKMKHEAKKSEMQQERKILEDKMKVILTPEQFTTWKTNQEKKREKVANRMKERSNKRTEIEN